jgi:uncharacterized membrane protein YeaQ/YmgE (transglycosylase-associated protein family)
MNFYIWCANGAGMAWFAGGMLGSKGKVHRVEDLLVGVFGAFIGAEFVVDAFRGGPPVPGFSVGSAGMAVLGAGVMLALLKMMREAVGPLRSGKSTSARRR